MKRIIPLLFMLAACSKNGTSPNTNTVTQTKPVVKFISSFSAFAGGVGNGTGFNFSVSNTSNNILYVDFIRDYNSERITRMDTLQTGNYKVYDYEAVYIGNTNKYHFETILKDNSKIVGDSFQP